MSTYAELDDTEVNPSAVTYISYTDKAATVHFIGGGSLVIKQDDAEKIIDRMHGDLKDLESIAETLDLKLMGRLDDIITELNRRN